MQAAIVQFRRNQQSVEDLGKLYILIKDNYPLLAVQSEEILRAQIALIVSALDNYVHDCVRLGMLEIFQGQRLQTKHYQSFPLNFIFLDRLLNSQTSQDRLNIIEEALRISNARDSFQSARGVEHAMNLISVDKVWTKIAPLMNMAADDVRNELGLIVDRRNKIVHEADFNFTTGTKYPIDKVLADNAIHFVSRMCESIQTIL
jgi:hypothetical protein